MAVLWRDILQVFGQCPGEEGEEGEEGAEGRGGAPLRFFTSAGPTAPVEAAATARPVPRKSPTGWLRVSPKPGESPQA